VRIGPNDLLTSDVEAFKKIHAVRSPYLRSNWYDALRLHPERYADPSENIPSTGCQVQDLHANPYIEIM